METIRASSADRAFACPQSRVDDAGIMVEGDRSEARIGTAVHAAMVSCIKNGRGGFDTELVHAACSTHCATTGDVMLLTRLAWNIWQQIAQEYPEPVLERELGFVHEDKRQTWLKITGHPDLYAIVGDEARILDWKTGRKEPGWWHQLRAYSWLVMQAHPEVQRVRASVILVRAQERLSPPEPGFWTRAEIDAWAEEFHRRVTDEANAYNPGEHCGYCRRALTCPAKSAMLRQAWQALTDSEANGHGLSLPIDAAKEAEFHIALYEKAKTLKKLSEDVLEIVKSHVETREGRLADGKHELVLVDEERQTVDWPAAKATLKAALSEEALDRCLTVNKGQLMKEVGAAAWDRATRTGNRGQAISNVLSALKAEGALQAGSCRKLVLRKVCEMPF